MTAVGLPGATEIRDLVARVVDPEIPVLTIADLGILREVDMDGERVVVTITPTYSGCPAMGAIASDIEHAVHQAGYHDVEVQTTLSPAWSTDWITAEGRKRLAEYGIAPPVAANQAVLCPRCQGGARTLSEFGSTACKALMVCTACGEPFDYFKAF